MDLPNDEIGISDLLNWRECPRRMRFGMKRHAPRTYTHPETGKDFEIREAPQAEGINNAFGSAFHDAAELVEGEAFTIDEAVTAVFPSYAQWLDPSDLDMLKKDLLALGNRQYKGVRNVAVEEDLRVPLFEYKGRTIYFRFKVDKLSESVRTPGRFIQIDYKSTKWPKGQTEWDNDLQQSAYNWGLHEYYPEIDDLQQVVDQLRAGPIILGRKTTEQRTAIKAFLIECATAVLGDEEFLPKWNEWCAFCPLKTDCPVITELTDFARTEISVIAPIEKQGRKKVVALDVLTMDEYAERLETVVEARKVLAKFEEAVKAAIKKMPEKNRDALGYATRSKRQYSFSPDALGTVHEALGDEDFYALASLSKTRLESHLDDDPDTLERLIGMMDESEGAVEVIKT